ncbi:Uma2 family endonuclease [Kamptonema sp. UHCC 0994]|uniref:Uma2 family endonuclease n=1 Tax=Kamptonema sp. UHCC 0994 TaxID=3031329 RepID=UPI0023BA274F|nr:Uma2 family endonuclease [Kamptonema sp. UHCC 0994]MDF0555148.1 Uma2 family endonuclease [Kamptonema sp. UHCC 0994]
MTVTKLRLWTVDEYHQMIETGILDEDDRVELLEGQIIEMSPQLPPHAATTQCSANYLSNLLTDLAYIRIQSPITLRPNSEPEPDIAVVRIVANQYFDHHPTPDEIFLVVEVANTSLAKDRRQKVRTYANANIFEYWILDVNERQVYVFREPGNDTYQQEIILNEEAIFSMVAFPEIAVSVGELFP